MAKNIPNRILLTENELPKQWYNVRADMPEQHDPFINPATMKPAVKKTFIPYLQKNFANKSFQKNVILTFQKKYRHIIKCIDLLHCTELTH